MAVPPRDLRPADPDALPDSSDPTGPCPRCGRPSNFTRLGSVPVTFREDVYAVERDGRYGRIELEQVTVLECAYCHQGTVVVERRGITAGPISWTGVHWWPPSSVVALTAATPAAISEALAEGLRALSAHAPRAAVVMFRGTLDAIVRDRGSAAAQAALRNRSLKEALQTMVGENALTPALGDWAAEIRYAGNAAAHVDPLDQVTQEEAASLAKLAKAVVEYLYELPARVSRSRTSASTL